MKKFFTFIKYIIASLSSFVVDIGIFSFLHYAFGLKIIYATIGARVVSSLFNFMLNKNTVFKSDASTIKTGVMYFMLVIATMFVSGYTVQFLDSKLEFNATIIKSVVDGLLFIANYNIQKHAIFKNATEE